LSALGFVVRLPVRRAGAAQAHRHHHWRRERCAYYQFAQRYAAILAKNGITLEVKASAGSLDNLRRLQADEAQVAFVQGGVVPPKADPDAEDDSGLLSLGSLFYEPVWVFYRGERDLTRLTELRGKRIAIGQEGSGRAPAGPATARRQRNRGGRTTGARCPA
jgi:TRAP-type uncharacterized transport system substrate-binding protein